MSRHTAFVGLMVIVAALPSATAAMSVAEFLAKTDALKARGLMAAMSSDIGILRGEIQAAATAYRIDVDAARAKGKTDLGCPPPKGQAKIGSDTIVADLAAIPKAAQPKLSVKAGLYVAMAKRYPCR